MSIGHPDVRTLPLRRVTRAVRTPHLQRTFRASGWMYSSRALVFGWALLLTHQFGIAEYGIYAMAFAVGAVIGIPLDSYFTIRAPRVSTEVFLRERTTRALLGLGLVVLGVLAWPVSFGAGFAVVKAGSDVTFQASRSSLIRDGHPDLAQRADAIRQVIGLTLGSAYLLIAANPTLEMAAGLYLAGSALPIAAGIRALAHARPLLPEVSGRSAAIMAEAVGGVVYVQAEVILLGLLGSPTSAGYYSFGATIVWSLAALGQSFGYTFHEGLRDSRGDVATGPRLSTALWLSASTCLVMAVIAGMLWQFDSEDVLWITFALLAPVSFLRTLSSVSTVVLAMQHRDRFRLGVTAASVALKVGLILLLKDLGGPGAAIAFLASDLVMSGSYTIAVYGRRGQTRAAPGG
jgi:O-antigen/teichoic acid export membrane protein